jgi:hypothetical protein
MCPECVSVYKCQTVHPMLNMYFNKNHTITLRFIKCSLCGIVLGLFNPWCNPARYISPFTYGETET